jgi:hypothetical protein
MTVNPSGGKDQAEISLTLDTTATEATLALLVKPGEDFADKDLPAFTFLLDGKEIKPQLEKENGKWAWYTVDMKAGTHVIAMKAVNETTKWSGSLQAWFLCKSPAYKQTISFTPKTKFKEKILPPLPMQQGIQEHQFELGIKDLQF